MPEKISRKAAGLAADWGRKEELRSWREHTVCTRTRGRALFP